MRSLLKEILPPRVVIAYKRLKRIFASKRFPKRTVEHRYCGYPLAVHIEDSIAEGWYDKDWDNLPELALLQKGKLTAGATVFNLGAHQAVVACVLSRIVGKNGRVIALEANPYCCEIAAKNRRINKVEQLDIKHCAIGDRVGEIVFGAGKVVSEHSKDIPVVVPMTTIDQMTEEYGVPDVLFIDVEGYEVNALRGAANTLLSRPDSFVEVHAGIGLEEFGGTVAKVLNFFPEEAYSLYFRTEGEQDFNVLNANQMLPSHRFFLVALAV